MNQEAMALLEEKKFPQLCRILKEMNPADLAALFAEFPEEYLPIIYRILPKELAAETFVCMDADLQEVLITAFSDKELREVLDEMYMDDTVDVIEEMPSNVVARILKNSNPADRRTINELLKYPSDSAGSIMTTEYVYLKKDMTVRDAFARIRKIGPDKETIYTCYVTDASRKLVGVVTVKDLLLAEQESVINDIMETNVIYVSTLEDKETAARLFDKYDLLAVPVVDQEQRLVGIITVDDAMDVLREENTEDILKMSAVTPTDDTYLKTSVFKHAKNRIVWLLILMVSATITGAIITKYEAAFTSIPLLIAFLPMLMDTGGNSGSQSSTTIIRGLALEEIKPRDFFRVLFKEVSVALMVGAVLAIVNTARVLITYPHDPIKYQLALVTGMALMCAVLIAKTLGCCLPMLAQKLKIDPALMAAPLMTTIVDAGTVLVYFSIATAVMHLTL
ncbi:MAG TPA: magnesium transporter [Oscillospiraceae bacterium]|nr:magnesium transporter [Oscillospiraceae bacterium]HPF55080.1 magnesium transporter [Clostridiales bacterium]HPK34431.1 magnesium transporter [Oscillospiraceae bacterium]HPR75584.1 magnesium transporter [Oscillospiraceae bacterium]